METPEGGPLTSFLTLFALAYVAATLLPSGVAHLARPRHFGGLVYTHGIVPPLLIGPVIAAVTALEVGAGSAALLWAGGVRLPVSPPALLDGAAVAGAVFFVYLLLLLARHPWRSTSCGCSPWSSPLTRASVLPALGLVLTGLLGRAAALGEPLVAAATPAGALRSLAALWGVTLAAVVALVPATLAATHSGSAETGG